ncbi:hypothetical protein PB01_10830 [Psychrobacillus glaciei]|uniref:Uncharacterized protein n=2 Tax=Psychrobacillus glaciei TaxID=2283160 RepID=A0A5J6SNC0_9BACI|nr:hypothetical protein PB01_10830 [Psychrobacillus glaciei]
MHINDATFGEMLKGNVPEQLADMLAMTQMSTREGNLVNDSSDLEMLLVRKPATVKEALQHLLA